MGSENNSNFADSLRAINPADVQARKLEKKERERNEASERGKRQFSNRFCTDLKNSLTFSRENGLLTKSQIEGFIFWPTDKYCNVYYDTFSFAVCTKSRLTNEMSDLSNYSFLDFPCDNRGGYSAQFHSSSIQNLHFVNNIFSMEKNDFFTIYYGCRTVEDYQPTPEDIVEIIKELGFKNVSYLPVAIPYINKKVKYLTKSLFSYKEKIKYEEKTINVYFFYFEF